MMGAKSATGASSGTKKQGRESSFTVQMEQGV